MSHSVYKILLYTLFIASQISVGSSICFWNCKTPKNQDQHVKDLNAKIRQQDEQIKELLKFQEEMKTKITDQKSVDDKFEFIIKNVNNLPDKFIELNNELCKKPDKNTPQIMQLQAQTASSLDKLNNIEKQILRQKEHGDKVINKINATATLEAIIRMKDAEMAELKAKERESAEIIRRLREELDKLAQQSMNTETPQGEKDKQMKEELQAMKNQNRKKSQESSNMERTLVLENEVYLRTYGNSSTQELEAKPIKILSNGQVAEPGWTVVQRRIDGSVNFYRNWMEYRDGFGDPTGEFFLGLEQLHRITKSAPHELYIHLESFDQEQRFAHYDKFEVGSVDEDYSLKSLGQYSGTAGNSLQHNVNQKFSTYDHDRDSYDGNCAEQLCGGWWYSKCGLSNLNGKYLYADVDYDSYGDGIFWDEWLGWTYSLKSVLIMIRANNNEI